MKIKFKKRDKKTNKKLKNLINKLILLNREKNLYWRRLKKIKALKLKKKMNNI